MKSSQQGSSNTSYEQGMNNKNLGYLSSNIINHSTINNNELSHMKTITIGGSNNRNRLSLSGIRNSNNLRGNEKPKLNNFMLKRNSQSKDPLLQSFSKTSETKQKEQVSIEQSDTTLQTQKREMFPINMNSRIMKLVEIWRMWSTLIWTTCKAVTKVI